MSLTLYRYSIRPPEASEQPPIEAWFAPLALASADSLTLAAFSDVGNAPLGAVMVTPVAGGTVGQFAVHVRPDARRQGIGRHLVKTLFQLAATNNAEHLALKDVLHQDDPQNEFYRAMGFTPDIQFGMYELDLARQVEPLCTPIARRFLASHPHLRDARVVGLGDVQPEAVTEFLAKNYAGLTAYTAERIKSGFDPSLSTVVTRADGTLTGITLIMTRKDSDVIHVDLVLVDSQLGQGPTPIAMFAETARRALAAGKRAAVFEADARRHPFAVGFAERCGVQSPKYLRYRYTIARAEILRRL